MLVEVKRINKEERTITTSLDIAETFEKEHRRVLQDIRELGCSKEFREHHLVQTYYLDHQNRKQPMYLTTRDGFTLLVMSYTGEKAMRFKEEYIKQFNAMENVLIGKMREREKGISVRHALTDALKQSTEMERMHGHAYSTYTNCIYKILFGMNASQLRESFEITKKDELRSYFSPEELKSIQDMELLVSGLVACGWGYDQIKDFIQRNNVKKIA